MITKLSELRQRGVNPDLIIAVRLILDYEGDPLLEEIKKALIVEDFLAQERSKKVCAIRASKEYKDFVAATQKKVSTVVDFMEGSTARAVMYTKEMARKDIERFIESKLLGDVNHG